MKEKCETYEFDLAFKKVFSYNILLEDFINSFLNAIKSNLKFSNSETTLQKIILPDNKDKKVYYGDIVAILSDGTIINIEIYHGKFNKSEYNKSLSYLCRLYSNQMMQGKINYTNIKKVISLNLMKENFNGKNDELINNYQLCNMVTKNIIGNGSIEMYLIRLDMSKNVAYTENESRFIKWLQLINALDYEEMEKIVKDDANMELSLAVIKEWNSKEEVQERFNTLYKSMQAEAKQAGLEQGIAQGIKQGIRENKLEVAKNMLNMAMPLDTISQATGLSVEQIEKIKL